MHGYAGEDGAVAPPFHRIVKVLSPFDGHQTRWYRSVALHPLDHPPWITSQLRHLVDKDALFVHIHTGIGCREIQIWRSVWLADDRFGGWKQVQEGSTRIRRGHKYVLRFHFSRAGTRWPVW